MVFKCKHRNTFMGKTSKTQLYKIYIKIFKIKYLCISLKEN